MDLHTHSTASDGILSPELLVSRAVARGVTLLALTDHDTQAGWPAARAAAQAAALDLVPGVELSATWRGRGVHIVGLGQDPDHPVLVQALAALSQVRSERGLAIARALARAGLSGEQDILREALAEADGAALGRPHFARALVRLGKVKSVNLAFKRYLGAGKPGDVKQPFPTLEQAVALIGQAGGVAVLAHPNKYKLTRTKLRELLTDFCAAGGAALEVISGRQLATETAELCNLAGDFGLSAALGSDFHQPDQPWQELGAAGELPGQLVPVWTLPALARWHNLQ